MSGRYVHLVGSLPGNDAQEAMTDAVRRTGDLLVTLPDGETAERRNWVISMVEALRKHPDLEEVRAGDWSDYDKVPKLRVRRGRTFSAETIDLGIVAAAIGAHPTYERLSADAGRPLSFQVGIPGDVDLALFTFGPTGPLRHRRPFTDALVRTIRSVRDLYGDDVVFQVEIPAEVVLLSKAPGLLRPLLARLLARMVTGLVARTGPGTRFGLHLCLGDMNHRAFGRISDAKALVLLTNAIVAGWPAGRPLEFVHLPLAHADEPPSTSEAFYAPLRGLQLPTGVRLVAGFGHEDQDLAQQERIRDLLDRVVGTRVDVSTSCGLGRRSAGSAHAALDRLAVLAKD